MMTKKIIFLTSLFISVFAASVAWADEELVFAIDLIRHGDRTPTVEIPNSVYNWKEGLGELTKKGIHQEYQNGVAFHKMYIEQNHLLPPQYKFDTMYVRSTDYDRTLMSAESVLSGLYPQQFIPIHTIPGKEDTMLIPDYDSKRRIELLERYVYTNKAWQEKEAELLPNFKRWGDFSGFTINHLRDLINLGGELQIRKIKHVAYPPEISADEAEKIIEGAKWAFVNSYKPREIGIVSSHELLSAINNYFVQVSQQKTSLKYVLFSAHDSTLLCMMSALDVPLDIWPPYASDIKFLLFKNENKYIVKIFFNGEPVNLPACGGASCTLDQFSSLAADVEAKSQHI